MSPEPSKGRRWKWSKRIYGTLVVLWIVTIVARVWWGYYADRKRQAILDAIASQGRPVYWEDLAPRSIPPAEDAAVLYRMAVEAPQWFAVHQARPGMSAREGGLVGLMDVLGDLLADDAFRRSKCTQVREVLEKIDESLALCRSARGKTAADWGIDFSIPPHLAELPQLSPYWVLTQVLCLAALDAHDEGRDGQAVELLRDGLAVSTALDRVPYVLGHLASLLIRNQVALAVEEIAPDLELGTGEGQAPPKSVRDLVRTLLDRKPMSDGLALAFAGERTSLFELYEGFRRLEVGLGSEAQTHRGGALLLFRFVCDPAIVLNEARMLCFMDALALSSREESYPQARRKRSEVCPDYDALADETRPRSALEKLGFWLDEDLRPKGLDRVQVLHFKALALSRMAGLALAIRQFELAHGRRPGKLAELVGECVPIVPPDPFDGKGGPIRYRADAAKPILYSVDEDGMDHGGRFVVAGGVLSDEEADDIPFFLDGRRPFKPVRAGSADAPRSGGNGSRSPHGRDQQHPERDQDRKQQNQGGNDNPQDGKQNGGR